MVVQKIDAGHLVLISIP